MVFIFLAETQKKGKQKEQPLSEDQAELLKNLNNLKDSLPKGYIPVPLYEEFRGRIIALGKLDERARATQRSASHSASS